MGRVRPVRIVVDNAACSGHGRGAKLAPGMYTLDERGYNAMHATEVPPGKEDEARLGADNCPEPAITVTD
jgi:ferredoxin